MHKSILLAAIVAAAMCSCSREQLPEKDYGNARADITVKLPSRVVTGTRSVPETADEKAVNSLQVYVFNEGGTTLESYGSGSSTSLTLSVSLGSKLVAALVNFDEVKDVTNIEALKAKISDLSDNIEGGFVMFGTEKADVQLNSTVEVDVTRLVARVVISSVTNAIEIPQYKDAPIKLKDVSLVNVGGCTDLTAQRAPDADRYYNKASLAGDLPSLLSKSYQQEIPNAESFDADARLYCYPNFAETDSDDSQWSLRFTRLVVTVEIAGRDWYYPISLADGVRANTSYEITELRITRLGSESPDEPIETGSATFTVNVNPWVYTDMSTVTI